GAISRARSGAMATHLYRPLGALQEHWGTGQWSARHGEYEATVYRRRAWIALWRCAAPAAARRWGDAGGAGGAGAPEPTRPLGSGTRRPSLSAEGDGPRPGRRLAARR